ncbi:hypothetical protein [Rhodanobacter lindaniclasticus]|uniref:Uncharacterized protein n=1 Tax=Rhodanobacter lindaniclasticus TaxID=75310 RepID=A0A4S3KC51_9GAMM|nr:hypothetical protein [Rhodanobacter lindaniclasticus]THD05992.1 hypothetical protein B1991_14945 [Rhodanobacter lindaniclasticus]
MKGIALSVLSAGLLLAMGGAAAADAPAKVSRIYTDTVAPASQQAYLAGIKSYNKCLAEHGFKYAWTALTHETGDVYAYSYVSDPVSWADFDVMRTQGKACDATFQQEVNPHLKGEISVFIQEEAEMSHTASKGMSSDLMEITYFKLKSGYGKGKAFTDAVKKITAAAAKSKWAYSYRFVRVMDGGADAPDFMVVSYSPSWAELGADADPSLWKMVESVYGKDGATDLRKTLGDTIEQQSSHVDRRDAELTYNPGR